MFKYTLAAVSGTYLAWTLALVANAALVAIDPTHFLLILH